MLVASRERSSNDIVVSTHEEITPYLVRRPRVVQLVGVGGSLLLALIAMGALLMSVGSSATCRLRYEGAANDITERQLQGFARDSGWLLTHPVAPKCHRCAESDRFPVWMAPENICRRFDLDNATHPLCKWDTENLPESHIKVCATQGQIDRAWADGGCHDGMKPLLGYDGDLFCAAGCTCHATAANLCTTATPPTSNPSMLCNVCSDCVPTNLETTRGLTAWCNDFCTYGV